ncbi:winged helix DNA-binding domain-containing protein [Streptosporangium sp. NPDC048047]|uniref:winged helix DNA-binding domain-containing protein n=1 Tax=Streptosporangium sp. NPDC048047 TaxID=3155748 RepID=UPI003423D115
MTAVPVVSRRTLNRTLLSRQFLAGRTTRSALEVVRHLVALQGQEPNWPYVGLWTRMDPFTHGDLESLLHERAVVRSAGLRRTQHLVAADDFRWLRPLIQPFVERAARGPYYAPSVAGLDTAELVETGRELLGDRVVPRRRLAGLLAERYPGRDGMMLTRNLELRVPLVTSPRAGAWGGWGTRPSIEVALAEAWIGEPVETAPSVEAMVLRYLAAFGPAGVMDAQAWSGITRLREVVDRLRPELRVLRDEQGRELFDLPGAPLAADDAPAPVRFLPAYDNVLLGHADRTRIISDEDRARVMPGRALVLPAFLVDGFVRGIWELRGTTLVVSPFRPLTADETESVAGEAERLHAFVVPGAPAPDVAFA